MHTHNQRSLVLCIVILLLLTAIIWGCRSPIRSGWIEDLSAGLHTYWSGIQPTDVNLVMNGEEIHHSDIPLGESVELVNEGVKGLMRQHGKVSAGCQLQIADEAGRVIFNEPDLFVGNDIFDPEKARRLSCMVNTGAPMQWDANYQVTVTFWDKFGQGKIENKFTIHTIDLP